MRLSTAKITAAVLLLALAGLQYKLWISPEGMAEVWRLEHAVKVQNDENERLTERNGRLYAEVRDLRDGLEAAEERARQDLGMIKDGESFYQVLDAPVVDEEFRQPE